MQFLLSAIDSFPWSLSVLVMAVTAMFIFRKPISELIRKSHEVKNRDVYDWITLLITVLGLCGLWYYAYWARVQGHATQLAAQTAQRQLSLSERPWVLATHKIDTPLTFNENGSAVLIIKETLQNSGQSAAIDVWSWAEMADLTAALTHQAQDCDQYRRPLPTEEKGNQTGFVLLPKQEVSSTEALALTRNWRAGQKVVSLAVVGCVWYTTLFEAKDAPRHETRFAYFLGIPGPTKANLAAVNSGIPMGVLGVEPKGRPQGVELIPTVLGNLAD